MSVSSQYPSPIERGIACCYLQINVIVHVTTGISQLGSSRFLYWGITALFTYNYKPWEKPPALMVLADEGDIECECFPVYFIW